MVLINKSNTASEILYDVEWEELFDNLGKTIKGVIANDN